MDKELDNVMTLNEGIVLESERFLQQVSEFAVKLRSKTSSENVSKDAKLISTREIYVQTERSNLTDLFYKESREIGVQTNIQQCDSCLVLSPVKIEPESLLDCELLDNESIGNGGLKQRNVPGTELLVPIKVTVTTENNCTFNAEKALASEVLDNKNYNKLINNAKGDIMIQNNNVSNFIKSTLETLEKLDLNGTLSDITINTDMEELLSITKDSNCTEGMTISTENPSKSVQDKLEKTTDAFNEKLKLQQSDALQKKDFRKEVQILESKTKEKKFVQEKDDKTKRQLRNENKVSLEQFKAKVETTSVLNCVIPKNDITRREVTVKGNEEDTIKCLDVAKKAIAENNFLKAERMLLKSERIYPTAKAKQLLEQIKVLNTAKELQKSMETDQNDPVESKPEDENKMKSMPFTKDIVDIDSKENKKDHKNEKKEYVDNKDGITIARAFIALEEDDYEFAETLLTNACLSHKSELAKIYLKILKDKIVKNEGIVRKPSKNNKDNSENASQSQLELKVIAEKHLYIANYLLARGIFTVAEYVLILANSLHPSDSCRKSLDMLQEYLKSYQQPFKPCSGLIDVLNETCNQLSGKKDVLKGLTYSYQVLESEEKAKYLELTQAAVLELMLVKAELCLAKAKYLSPSFNGDGLMSRIQSLLSSKDNQRNEFILTDSEKEWPKLRSNRSRNKYKTEW